MLTIRFMIVKHVRGEFVAVRKSNVLAKEYGLSTMVSGDTVTGNMVTGDMVTGAMVTGDTVTGATLW
jgi:hypothetical protein